MPEADSSFEVYHINRLKEILGHGMCFQLLFIHSIFGSEMTSWIFVVGKTAFQKLAKGDPVLQSCVNAFTSTECVTKLHFCRTYLQPGHSF